MMEDSLQILVKLNLHPYQPNNVVFGSSGFFSQDSLLATDILNYCSELGLHTSQIVYKLNNGDNNLEISIHSQYH